MNPANDNSFFTAQRTMRFGTAVLLDLAKFTFSIVLLLAPLIAGYAVTAAVQQKCNGIVPTWLYGEYVCNGVAIAAGSATALGLGFLEYATGVGDAAVAVVGEVFDDAIDFMAWILFSIWFFITGVKFWGGGRSANRTLAAGASLGAGLIPFLNLFPTITVGVVLVDWNQYKEEQAKARTKPKASPKVLRTQQLETQRAALAVRQQQEMEAYAQQQAIEAANDQEEFEESAAA